MTWVDVAVVLTGYLILIVDNFLIRRRLAKLDEWALSVGRIVVALTAVTGVKIVTKEEADAYEAERETKH